MLWHIMKFNYNNGAEKANYHLYSVGCCGPFALGVVRMFWWRSQSEYLISGEYLISDDIFWNVMARTDLGESVGSQSRSLPLNTQPKWLNALVGGCTARGLFGDLVHIPIETEKWTVRPAPFVSMSPSR